MRSLVPYGVFLCVLVPSFSIGATVEKRASQSYSIEMGVVVDSYAFDSWKGYVASSEAESTKDDVTRSALTNYVKSAVHDVNSIFNELSKSGINLDVRVFSTEFVTEKISDSFNGMLDSSKMLNEFKTWLSGKNYSTVDHTMLLTGLDLTGNGNSGVAGIAYLGQMCEGDFSISVIEATPTGAVTRTMAHELGHSLSAQHDGDGNSCVAGSYIMQASNAHASTSNQSFRFSECSVNYFNSFLGGGKSACLQQTTTTKESTTPLGQVYDADRMCQMVEGPLSHVCRSLYGEGQTGYSETCLSVLCAKPGENLCRTIASADGFLCGDGKRCFLGDCVPDSSATTCGATDTCPLGDTPVPVSQLNNQTCSEAIASYPGYCYQAFAQRVCCQSCETVRSPRQNCSYGDKAPWCSGLKKYDCYVNDEVCCATCAEFETNVTDCKYGDRSPDCARLDDWNCKWNKDLCCDRCK